MNRIAAIYTVYMNDIIYVFMSLRMLFAAGMEESQQLSLKINSASSAGAISVFIKEESFEAKCGSAAAFPVFGKASSNFDVCLCACLLVSSSHFFSFVLLSWFFVCFLV